MSKRKIILILKGGLGNQLFQYAMARSCMGFNDSLFFHTGSYDNDSYNRKFALNFFNIKGTAINIPQSWVLNYTIAFLKKFLSFSNALNEITESGFFLHNRSDLRIKHITVIQGFWQTEEYFRQIRNELLRELEPRCEIILPDYISKSNSVAIHVRRTDYLLDKRYGFIGEEYYRVAIEILREKLEEPTFVFFSDDINYCKLVFSDTENAIFHENKKENECAALYLMSKCQHQIIANSSFSWWGAWLNSNLEKIVVCPKYPFADKTLFYEKYYPSEWLKV